VLAQFQTSFQKKSTTLQPAKKTSNRKVNQSPRWRFLLSGSLCASFKEVEHPCQQCGSAVEDGRPFCPQCRAPQIHVPGAFSDGEIAAGLDSGLGKSPSGHLANLQPDHPRPSATAIDSRIATRAALKAGVLGIFIGAIPFIGIALTGALAVFFYNRKSGLSLPAVLGARLGGAAGFVVWATGAFFALATIMLHAQQQCIDSVTAAFQKFGANTADPAFQASIHSVFTPSGQATAFLIAIVSASIGGALASVFMRPSNDRK